MGEQDAGLYKVKAKNKCGEVSASINLNFSPDQPKPGKKQIDGTAPTFTQKPVIKQEDGGKHIKFECRIMADPKPVISWSRDGHKVQESPRCKVVIEPEDKAYLVTMSLKNVTVEDAGKYKVTAKNQLGESNANISLNFDIAPTIKAPPRIVSIINRKVLMECVVMSASQPACTWFQNSAHIKMDARHTVTVQKSSEGSYLCQLEISKVELSDCGSYKLVAKNEKGETTSQTVEITKAMIEEKKEEKKEDKKKEEKKEEKKDEKKEEKKVEEKKVEVKVEKK